MSTQAAPLGTRRQIIQFHGGWQSWSRNTPISLHRLAPCASPSYPDSNSRRISMTLSSSASTASCPTDLCGPVRKIHPPLSIAAEAHPHLLAQRVPMTSLLSGRRPSAPSKQKASARPLHTSSATTLSSSWRRSHTKRIPLTAPIRQPLSVAPPSLRPCLPRRSWVKGQTPILLLQPLDQLLHQEIHVEQRRPLLTRNLLVKVIPLRLESVP